MLNPDERRAQLNLARATAVEAGRDPQALEYTRWASTELTSDGVEDFAAQGVTRLVLNVTGTDPIEQREEMAAFADRFRLADGAG